MNSSRDSTNVQNIWSGSHPPLLLFTIEEIAMGLVHLPTHHFDLLITPLFV